MTMNAHSDQSRFLDEEKNTPPLKTENKSAFLPEGMSVTVSVFKSVFCTEPLFDIDLRDLLLILHSHSMPSGYNDEAIQLIESSRMIVERMRAVDSQELKSSLKKQLPAFTPHARTSNRGAKALDKGLELSGWVQVDIDGQDNTHLTATQIKNEVKQWPFIAYCAYSVSGKGVWALAKCSSSLANTSESIHEFAHARGIKVDSSKGKAPTELRLISFDQQPWINTNPSQVPKLKPRSIANKRKTIVSYQSSSLKEKTIQRLLVKLNSATEGARHHTRLVVGKLAGGYAAGGLFSTHEITEILVSDYQAHFAHDPPTVQKKEIKTITDGIAYGLREPIMVQQKALAVPYDDCESGDYTITLTQNNIVFEFNCDAIVDVTGSLVYLKEHVFDNMDIKPKVVHGMSKVYHK